MVNLKQAGTLGHDFCKRGIVAKIQAARRAWERDPVAIRCRALSSKADSRLFRICSRVVWQGNLTVDARDTGEEDRPATRGVDGGKQRVQRRGIIRRPVYNESIVPYVIDRLTHRGNARQWG